VQARSVLQARLGVLFWFSSEENHFVIAINLIRAEGEAVGVATATLAPAQYYVCEDLAPACSRLEIPSPFQV
jgi:hypothetical protein